MVSIRPSDLGDCPKTTARYSLVLNLRWGEKVTEPKAYKRRVSGNLRRPRKYNIKNIKGLRIEM